MCFASGSRPSYADTESINLGAFAFCASPAETLPRQRCFDFSGFQVVQFSRATRAARSRIHFSNFEFFPVFPASCVNIAPGDDFSTFHIFECSPCRASLARMAPEGIFGFSVFSFFRGPHAPKAHFDFSIFRAFAPPPAASASVTTPNNQ